MSQNAPAAIFHTHTYTYLRLSFLCTILSSSPGSLLIDGYVDDESSVGGSSVHGQAIDSMKSTDSNQHDSDLFSALSPLGVSTSNRIMVSYHNYLFSC